MRLCKKLLRAEPLWRLICFAGMLLALGAAGCSDAGDPASKTVPLALAGLTMYVVGAYLGGFTGWRKPGGDRK